MLGLSCHLASPSLSGTTDPPRFYDDSSSARHSSQARRQPLNRRLNHDRAWGGFCNKPETRTVSLTVMLMGLVIEEDTKKSKRGCEELDQAGRKALCHYRLTIAKGKIAAETPPTQSTASRDLQVGHPAMASNAPFQGTRG